MSPESNTESYLAFAHIGLRENPGKSLNQGNLESVGRPTDPKLPYATNVTKVRRYANRSIIVQKMLQTTRNTEFVPVTRNEHILANRIENRTCSAFRT
ncbi:hypothetical protein ANN_18903 [Periplaneta americana]|uniref:Uncharacterized protein n=1 Tax=Periplaneta americana TaxID=6978 RepID=A0ABQ8SQ17_PERAM|nr:hypothetical protein ANN_18903 [Periplaneta americana]